MNMVEHLDSICEKTRHIFNEAKEHPPLFMLNMKNGIALLPCLWSKKEDKEIYVKGIKQKIANNEINEFIFIAEAWTKSCKTYSEVNEEYRKHGSLEFAEGKREILMVQYQSFNESVMFIAEINRDGDEVTLGEWEKIESYNKEALSLGLFDNMFTMAVAANN
jgi:hypothetical protein